MQLRLITFNDIIHRHTIYLIKTNIFVSLAVLEKLSVRAHI